MPPKKNAKKKSKKQSAKAAVSVDDMGGRLTKQQAIDFNKMFSALDTNKDGRLSATETVTCIRALRLTPTEADVNLILEDIEENYAGLVDFKEFRMLAIEFVKEDGEPEKILRRAFRMWDKKLNGLISAEDLRVAVTTLGEILPEDEIAEFMREANPDREGFVNYEDFIVRLTLSS